MGADAKIDLEKVCHLFIFHFFFMLISYNQNVVVINRPSQPVYHNIIEKTRQLAVRTQALGVAMARSGQQGAFLCGNGPTNCAGAVIN